MMLRTFWIATYCLLFIKGLGLAADRHSPLHIVYPPDLFVEQGGHIINVTHPPFNAKGDGITDDTHAIIQAYDTLAAKMRGGDWDKGTGLIFYFPKGTYLVSNTLIYSGPRLVYNLGDPSIRDISKVRFIGEDRNSTTIKLKDNCPGFEKGQEKYVLTFLKDYEPGLGNNIPAMNLIRNLTINTGSGNPGAIAAMFMGANVSSIDNLSIKSNDGTGRIGLDFPIYSVQGHMRDITIEGFDIGIRIKPLAEDNPTLEYISLSGQKQVGILVEQGSPNIRKLSSDNSVPALQITNHAAHVVLIDSDLRGGAASTAAIDIIDTTSQLFARSVSVTGYGAAVHKGKTDAVKGNITEYVSDHVYTLWDSPQMHSMNLPIEDAPLQTGIDDLNEWANVEKYPGADLTEKTQNAMNSGKSVVYFPKENYSLARSIKIPATVKYIYLSYNFTIGTFQVTERSNSPLWIEDFNGAVRLEQIVPRTIVLRNSRRIMYYNLQKEPTKIFIESASDLGGGSEFCNQNVTIFGRSIDNENHNSKPNFEINGGRLWTLGFKTEGAETSFHISNGGQLEVLGGYRNETTADQGFPMIINDSSNVSVVAYSNMSQIYEQAVWETRGGITRKLLRTQLPARLGYDKDFYIPLYVGYSSSEYPIPLTPMGIQKSAQKKGELPMKVTPNNYGINILGQKLIKTENAKFGIIPFRF